MKTLQTPFYVGKSIGRVNILKTTSTFALILAFLSSIDSAGCKQKGLQEASLKMINEAQAQWEHHPVRSYNVVVVVQQGDHLRKNELQVKNGKVIFATVRFWDSNHDRWGDRVELNERQALPFTIPGLFETVREELIQHSRENIRVAMNGNPPFPRTVVLGPLIGQGGSVQDSTANISVKHLSALSKDRAAPCPWRYLIYIALRYTISTAGIIHQSL